VRQDLPQRARPRRRMTWVSKKSTLLLASVDE
jgi:hypothetical protein